VTLTNWIRKFSNFRVVAAYRDTPWQLAQTQKFYLHIVHIPATSLYLPEGHGVQVVEPADILNHTNWILAKSALHPKKTKLSIQRQV
jgi:hypothetical protein